MTNVHPNSQATRGRRLPRLACCVLLAAAAAGCQTAAPAARRPGVDIDPCAERLHDTCGRFLLYFSIHGRLPDTLDELKRVDAQALPPPSTGGRTGPLVCPISGKPYVYSKDGPRLPGRAGLLVLYDAEPVHSGMRWGIMVEAGGAGQPLSGRVVLLPESSVFSTNK